MRKEADSFGGILFIRNIVKYTNSYGANKTKILGQLKKITIKEHRDTHNTNNEIKDN